MFRTLSVGTFSCVRAFGSILSVPRNAFGSTPLFFSSPDSNDGVLVASISNEKMKLVAEKAELEAMKEDPELLIGTKKIDDLLAINYGKMCRLDNYLDERPQLKMAVVLTLCDIDSD